MVVREFCILALLVCHVAAEIDCSHVDTCFGEPQDCNPHSTCKTLFRFDEKGNLDLYLRNITDSKGYAAFAVNRDTDETYEYFICIPHEEQRLRAFAELGEAILVTEQNITGVVENLGENFFRCTFNSIELPEKFQKEQVFFVSSGTFAEALVIVDGVQLFNLDAEYEDGEDFEKDSILPTASAETKSEVLTNAVKEMEPFADSKTAEMLERMARKASDREQRFENRFEDSNESESLDELLPRRLIEPESNSKEDSFESEYNDNVVTNNRRRVTKYDLESSEETPYKRIRPNRVSEIIDENYLKSDDENDRFTGGKKDKRKADDYEEYELENFENEGYDDYTDNSTNHAVSFGAIFLLLCRLF